MRPFTYLRPTTLPETLGLLREHDGGAVLLAGGTDLLIALRDGAVRPSVVLDVKGVDALTPAITMDEGQVRIGATTVMTDLVGDERVRRHLPALAEAAAVVGSVQIRNRATLAGNLCNASPAADTAPALLVYDASVVISGPDGERRLPLEPFFVRSGVTALGPGELLTRIDVPLPDRPRGSVHLRRTRRRGHDLAAVTLAVAVDAGGVTRLSYGSVGPRPVLAVDASGVLADPGSPAEAQQRVLDGLLAAASPSPTSMRAGPAYRLAMLRVLAHRGLATARERLAEGGPA